MICEVDSSGSLMRMHCIAGLLGEYSKSALVLHLRARNVAAGSCQQALDEAGVASLAGSNNAVIMRCGCKSSFYCLAWPVA